MDVQRTITGSEPVSLTDMKLYLKVDFTTDDALITQLIKSVREHCEEFTGKSFVASDVTWYVEAEAGQSIRMPYPAIDDVDPVEGITFLGLDNKRALFTVSGSYEIEYTTTGTCPHAVKLAIMKAVAEAYENRQNTGEGSGSMLPESTYHLLMQYTI
jgi:hypothetical protein